MTENNYPQTLHQLNQDIVACRACPRLVAWREKVARTKRRAYQDWDYWGKPVPGFGDPDARLLLVGLAPGAHGANRTGRPFTGDGSGTFLMAALHRAGFANQAATKHRGDDLCLQDCYITGIARCAPPKNRPTAQELTNCRPYLQQEFALLQNVQVVMPLGRMAFEGTLRALRAMGHTLPRLDFGHGARYELPGVLPHLLASYHPSRQNTQTGLLTEAMMDEVLLQARALMD